jgi:hypothetical protein
MIATNDDVVIILLSMIYLLLFFVLCGGEQRGFLDYSHLTFIVNRKSPSQTPKQRPTATADAPWEIPSQDRNLNLRRNTDMVSAGFFVNSIFASG